MKNKLPSLVITSAHGSKVSRLTDSTSNKTKSTSDSSTTSESSSKSGVTKSIIGSISSSKSGEAESPIGNVSTSKSGSNKMDNPVGGHPKGSIVQAALGIKSSIEHTTHDAVVSLSEVVSKKKKGQHLKRGLFTQIIAAAKENHDVAEDVTILETTIRQQLKHKSNKGQPGLASPMKSIEPYIVSIIIQLANMRVPILSSQGLSLCNSIIEGTQFQNDAVAYKKLYCWTTTEKLGQSYCRGFLRRNTRLLRAKKAVKNETKCSERCTYESMKEMYTEVYSHLADSHLAVKHPGPVWRNADEEIVDENQALG